MIDHTLNHLLSIKKYFILKPLIFNYNLLFSIIVKVTFYNCLRIYSNFVLTINQKREFYYTYIIHYNSDLIFFLFLFVFLINFFILSFNIRFISFFIKLSYFHDTNREFGKRVNPVNSCFFNN